jgi:putative SOS response-associated peptidase YedK
MCINFLPPSRQQLQQHFGLSADGLLWPEETWQDYAAPIIVGGGAGSKVMLASYGMVPKRHLPLGVRLSTMNARAETVGELRTFKSAWQQGQLCLVPMQAFFEPCYESGKAERWRIGLADSQPFAVAGLWRAWQEEDGSHSHAFTQITINADTHPLMCRMHRPGEEKRNLVIVPPEDYQVWLGCRQSEQARAFLQNYPAERMLAVPSPKPRAPSPQLGLFD